MMFQIQKCRKTSLESKRKLKHEQPLRNKYGKKAQEPFRNTASILHMEILVALRLFFANAKKRVQHFLTSSTRQGQTIARFSGEMSPFVGIILKKYFSILNKQQRRD